VNADLQSKLALAIVAGAAAGLIVAWLRRRRRAGGGADCGCANKPAKVGGARGRR